MHKKGCAQTEPGTKGMMIQSTRLKICSIVCSSAPSYSAKAARNLYSKHQDSPESELNFAGNKLLNAQFSMLGHVAKECPKSTTIHQNTGIKQPSSTIYPCCYQS